MVYDPALKRVILFGGGDDLRKYGDTWSWDGVNWTCLHVVGPSPRLQHTMAYDECLGRVVLFGGWPAGLEDPLADTWEWDGCRWSQVRPPTSPHGRRCAGMTFDPERRRVVLVGGYPEELCADVWEYGARAQ
jgi:hypothetical protein